MLVAPEQTVIEVFEHRTMTVEILRSEVEEPDFWYHIFKTDVRRSRYTNSPGTAWNGTGYTCASDARHDAVIECDKEISHNYIYPPED